MFDYQLFGKNTFRYDVILTDIKRPFRVPKYI